MIPHVVSTAVEHPAILEYLRAKEAEKVLTYELVPVNDEGLVDPQDVAAAVTERTCLVSVMHANNETGAIQPVAECAQLCKARNPKVLVHTDAAQSCGKIPVKVNELCVDMCTIVGHKIGAPKGVAALYVQKRRSVFKALTRRRAGRWTTRGHRERAARRRPRRRVRARRGASRRFSRVTSRRCVTSWRGE